MNRAYRRSKEGKYWEGQIALKRATLDQSKEGEARRVAANDAAALAAMAAVAPMVEQAPCKGQVAGSNPCQRHQQYPMIDTIDLCEKGD